MGKEWIELSREQVFDEYGRNIDKVVFKLPNGRSEKYFLRDDSDSICILPITNDKKIILAEQFRPGPKEVLLELPGGRISEDEAPLEAAERELLEETGYAGKMYQIAVSYDDAYSNRRRYCFVAEGCQKVKEQKLDDNEFIEVKLLPIKMFRKLLRGGKMIDIEVGYLGLDYLGLL